MTVQQRIQALEESIQSAYEETLGLKEEVVAEQTLSNVTETSKQYHLLCSIARSLTFCKERMANLKAWRKLGCTSNE
jgi:hypothetical protein